MDNMEEKLGAILNNPQIMQQIMSIASDMGNHNSDHAAEQAPEAPILDIDPTLLLKLSGLAGQTGIDSHQQNLLQALTPYLSGDRIHRLERAMRAAKTARVATDLIGNGGLNFLTGR